MTDHQPLPTSDPDRVPTPEGSTESHRVPSSREKAGLVAAVLGVLGVILVYIWDDLIFAAPVIATAGWLGAWPAFLIFSVVYGVGSFLLAMAAVKAYEKWSHGESSRLANWLDHQSHSRRGVWATRLMAGGKVLGFVASSFVLGAIATTWLIRYAGRRENMAGVAAVSSAIFGITFVGSYAGVAALIF